VIPGEESETKANAGRYRMKNCITALVLAGFLLQPVSKIWSAGLEILQPAGGQVFYQNETVNCRARCSDELQKTDQELRYVWSSDIDGILTEGLEASIGPLSYRLHRLRVEAFHGDSVVADAEISLMIVVSPVQFTLSARDDWEGEFSPGGTLVAFTSFRSGDPEIWTASSTGQGTERITYKGGWGATWSSDGARLAFWSERSGTRDIWMVNLDDDPLVAEPLVAGPSSEWSPVFSPLDNRVAFVAKQGKRLSLQVINADDPSLGPTEVVGPEYYPMFPRWLPDATGLVFTSFADSLPVVCSISFESGVIGRIAGPGVENADISPDGKWLVMVLDQDVWLQRMSDSLLRPLTREKAGAMCPRFSPDGKLVIFASHRSGNFDLWLVGLPDDI
jgi:Tol biopolymer transport system component